MVYILPLNGTPLRYYLRGLVSHRLLESVAVNDLRFWGELKPEEKEAILWRIVFYRAKNPWGEGVLNNRVIWGRRFLVGFLLRQGVVIRLRGGKPKNSPGGDPHCLNAFLNDFREFKEKYGVPVIFNDELGSKSPLSRRQFITPSTVELVDWLIRKWRDLPVEVRVMVAEAAAEGGLKEKLEELKKLGKI